MICPPNAKPIDILQFIKDQKDKANSLIAKHNANIPQGDPQEPVISPQETCKIIREILVHNNNAIAYGNKTEINANIQREVRKLNFRTIAQFELKINEVEAKAIPEVDKHRLPSFESILPNTDQLSLNITREKAFQRSHQPPNPQYQKRKRSDQSEVSPIPFKRGNTIRQCRYTDEECYHYKKGTCKFGHPPQCKFGMNCWRLNDPSTRCPFRHTADEISASHVQPQTNKHYPTETKPTPTKPTATKTPIPHFNPTRRPTNQLIQNELHQQQQNRTPTLFTMEQFQNENKLLTLQHANELLKEKCKSANKQVSHTSEINAQLRKTIKQIKSPNKPLQKPWW
eukprot:325356_1